MPGKRMNRGGGRTLHSVHCYRGNLGGGVGCGALRRGAAPDGGLAEMFGYQDSHMLTSKR